MNEVMRNQINKGMVIIKDIMDYFKAWMSEEIEVCVAISKFLNGREGTCLFYLGMATNSIDWCFY